jgi:adenylate cyclase
MGEASALKSGSDGPARWSLRLLGDFQLVDLGSGEKVVLPGKRERVLLAYLALSPNGQQPRRKLVTLLWGEAADETTLDNLRTAVFNLRKALGDAARSVVASEDRDIVLDASAFEVDVLAIRRLAAGSGVELEEATKLYAGDFLDGLSIESEEFESWRREESARCKGQILDALTKLMTQLAASGESERAIEAGLRILRLEPLHEAAARSLMRLYAGSGRRATAVELYRTVSDSLKKELGVQPEAETRAVYAEIARGNEGQSAAIGDVESAAPTATPRSAPPATEHVVPLGAPAPAALQKVNRRKIGWLAGGLAGAAALAIAFFALGPSLAPAPTGRPATVVAATPTSAVALAVLPFANLSSDPEQEFFSDGLTEEIASALAKVPDLKLVARTSAFEFKNQNRNIRTIGEQLGATHLIEGSVRKAGDRVRVTVQLIAAEDGTRVWSEDYDRQLTDIFVIQEDIAKAIASALSVPLRLSKGDTLVRSRTVDAASYDDFLRARALLRAPTISSVTEAARLLEQVVARDPEFAPAWAQLSLAYIRGSVFHPAVFSTALDQSRAIIETNLPKAEAAAQRALQLDAKSSDGHIALGYLQALRGRFSAAEDLYTRALALDGDHGEALYLYSVLLADMGYVKRALPMRQRLSALEPFVPLFTRLTATIMWVGGQTDEAIDLLQRVPEGFAAIRLAHIYGTQGRYDEAADLVLSRSTTYLPGVAEAASRLLRTAPTVAASPETLPRLGEYLDFVYLAVGAPSRVLDFHEDRLRLNFRVPLNTAILWARPYEGVRKTERFKAYVRNAGLVDYWRAKGWPDLCRPMGADDFECG